MIKVLIGDMFKSEAKTLVNTVNCVGVMGKGIAEEFKKRFPEMVPSYKKDCLSGALAPGKPTLYRSLLSEKLILNFPTKRHWKSPTLLKDIQDGLDYFVDHYEEWNLESVAFPPLGCGNGGLNWQVVGPLMYQKLENIKIPVEIYAPYGTPTRQLKLDFLNQKINFSQDRGSWARGNLTSGNVAVLEVLYRLQNAKYANPIGRTMYQKACYILTEAGVKTDYIFERYHFGPFSREAEKALSIYANNNLTQEEHIGSLIKLTVTIRYEEIREQFREEIEMNAAAIEKAVDLLSRIKDTSQGEEVATVMYASNIIALQSNTDVTADEVLNYIIRWKSSWSQEGKRKAVLETISDLNMLRWTAVSPTKETRFN